MQWKYQIWAKTMISLLLICGIFATLFYPNSLSDLHDMLPTDAGVGLDAGNEPTITIVIDAGHGGEDGGTQSASGTFEKTVNLEIARLLDTMLRANGINSVMTRTEDILLYDRHADYVGHKKMLDLATRRKITEETENAVFVSIHMNSFPETKYHGLQVFYSPHHSLSQTLASEIQTTTQKYLQPDNQRKVKKATSAIYLLDRLTCPAVLVECGFLSNPAEAARFETSEYRQQVAWIIFCSIMSYISNQNA